MKPGRAVGKRHGFVQIAGVDKKICICVNYRAFNLTGIELLKLQSCHHI